MNDLIEGDVVIVGTGQAGTITDDNGSLGLVVLLANGDMWYGSKTQCRLPQDEADLAAAPRDFDRFEGRDKAAAAAPKRPRQRFDD